ncbi:MAG: endonuclease [Eubacteriales bacterium]|nr:endonuclease [Eubacteriales bacterium]
MKWVKGLGKLLAVVAIVAVVVAVGLLGYLSLIEYQPEAVEPLEISVAAQHTAVKVGDALKVISFNTGYGGLDRTEDFFMDGGKAVSTGNKEQVEQNLAGILSALNAQEAQIYLLQEVDKDSARTFSIDQGEYYRHGLSLNTAFAYNYRCQFVPYPWPPIGKVNSGVLTMTQLAVTEAERDSLPVPFSWPLRIANLKRCLLIERVPVEGTDRELVIINLHLEAYDDGQGKAAQTAQLMNIIQTEYSKGNYVIAGGDFNQTFEGVRQIGASQEGKWQPGQLANSELPSGARYVFDSSTPSCRSLDQPYTGDRENFVFYVIDGFIITDNLKLQHVETIDLNFQNSDHNPVMMQVELL